MVVKNVPSLNSDYPRLRLIGSQKTDNFRLMQTLFLDTNILLHYKPMRSIDWRALCGEPVRLCVCITVIHELDKKKSDPRLKDRARRAIDEIRLLISTGKVRDGVIIEVSHQELRREDFPHGYDTDSADDAILLHAKSYKDAHPEDQVAVVSEDLGMELKCKAHGFSFLTPRNEDREEVIDDYVREKRKLQKELDELKRRLPSLWVQFNVGDAEPTNQAIRRLKRPELKELFDIEALCKQWPKYLPKQQKVDVFEMYPPPGSPVSQFYNVPPEEYVRYNREVDVYLQKCEQYNVNMKHWVNTCSRKIDFKLLVTNEGNAPATNIDIYLHFPDGLIIETVEAFLKREPMKPNVPTKPRTTTQILEEKMNNINYDVGGGRRPNFDLINSKHDLLGPTIQHTNSFDVSYKLLKLKHGDKKDLGSLVVIFDSEETAKSFDVSVRITSDDLPNPDRGTLNFIIHP